MNNPTSPIPTPWAFPVLAALICFVLLSNPASGAGVRQLTDLENGSHGLGVMDDAGTTVFVNTNTDQLGANGELRHQLFKFDALTGSGEMLTEFDVGVTDWDFGVSVSDDGQWIAFISAGDLTGGNHDMSRELFVIQSEGSNLQQLTSDPAVNAGSVTFFQMAGDGSSVVFVSTADLTGANPSHHRQVFKVDRDGTDLTQVTSADPGVIWCLVVSDDGTRIVYTADGDPLGSNADGSIEVFAIDSSGSGLRQLSADLTEDSQYAAIAGGGSKVAFESDADFLGTNADKDSEIYVIDWDGANLVQVTQGSMHYSAFPTITDDGEWIAFYSSEDWVLDIWKVRNDGTMLSRVTNLGGAALAVWPQFSGSGNRISAMAFNGVVPGGNNPDGNLELHVMDSSGGNLRQLTFTSSGSVLRPDISPDGSRIVFLSSDDLVGENPNPVRQIYWVDADSAEVSQVTGFTSRSTYDPTIAADNSTIVFIHDGDPLGSNADYSTEVFKVNADGSGLTQLTSGSGYGADLPEISADGSVVVFASALNYAGANGDGSYEIFKVNIDGSGIDQLTSGSASEFSYAPRIDATGTWCVFETTANLGGGIPDDTFEVFRVRSDGTSLLQITSHASLDSLDPDISGDGDLVVYASPADFVGTNPEGNEEIFLYQVSTGVTRQLTSFARGSSERPRISQDGSFVYFISNAPVFENDPDDPMDLYGVNVGSGEIVRASAERGTANAYDVYISHLSSSSSGLQATFTGVGDFVQENPDGASEIWLIDRTAPPSIEPDGAAPTVLRWGYEAGPVRYDVIRGQIDQLSAVPESVDLGPVICLEDDSPDANTVGFEDMEDPDLGTAFFYLYRGTQGLAAGPGSWGSGSGDRERSVGAGDCSP